MISFDAVAKTQNRIYIVEIKFARYGILRSEVISLVYRRINNFYSTLNAEMQQKFTFIFAVVIDDTASEEAYLTVEKKINIAGKEFPFTTIPKVYKLNDLTEKTE
jgi:hypothetical protein